ncbi:MAG: acylneuraminate cytidylyltransferase family protein [Terriglobales bacterium]|jgi:N-acylneuraminate cytidylyltransferase
MLSGKRVVAVIPARGGSKSVPGKNIRSLGGKPLLAWSIDVAKQVSEIDRTIVSTDDAQIASVGRAHGAEVYARPAHLATDEALVIDALKDLLQRLEEEGETVEWVILLEPTCPLRTADDVRDCLRLVTRGEYDSVATFKDAELNPHRAWRLVDGVPEVFISGAIPWLPRQKLPKAYQLNGAVYVFRANLLAQEAKSLLVGKLGAVLMPRDRSQDIDDSVDFDIVEALLKQSNS